MSVEVDQALLLSYADWAHAAAHQSMTPFLAITGAPKIGKSRLFQLLADQQPHREPFGGQQGIHWIYWDLGGESRLRSFEGFWSALGEIAGDSSLFSDITPATAGYSEKLQQALDLFGVLGGEDSRLMLVLDHWAEARHGGGDPRVNIAAVQLLTDALQRRTDGAVPRLPHIGWVLVTSFPTTDMLVTWARKFRANSPGLWSLSGEIHRRSSAVHMPFLQHKEAVAVAMACGAPRDLAEEVAKHHGGWLAPLIDSAARAGSEHSFDEAARRRGSARTFSLLRDPLLSNYPSDEDLSLCNIEEPERRAAVALGRIVRRISLGIITAEAVGVPTQTWLAGNDAHRRVVSAVADAVVSKAYLIVDTENLILHYTGPHEIALELDEKKKRHMRDEAYRAMRVFDFYRLIEDIALELGVVPGPHIVLGCRDAKRLSRTFGSPTKSWTLVHRGESWKEDDGSGDDTAMATFASSTAALEPAATFYFLSGDIDHRANLHGLTLNECALLAPWSISSRHIREINPLPNWSWRRNVMSRSVPSGLRRARPAPETLAELRTYTT